MTEFPARLQEEEQELDRRELELAAAERSLDAKWASHEHRIRVLTELREYVTDREITLRARAARLGLPPGAIDELLGAGMSVDHKAQPPGMNEVALGTERAALLEARSQLCERREQALAHREELFAEADSGNVDLEEALLSRENELATVFRKLVERSGELAMGSIPAPITTSMPEITAEALDTEANRRRFKRIELNARVDFGTPHNFFAGESENISIGGVFIATNNLIREGRQVDLRLTLPQSGSFDIRGEVSWRRLVSSSEGPPGLGIRFLNPDPSLIQAIEAFVKVRDALP